MCLYVCICVPVNWCHTTWCWKHVTPLRDLLCQWNTLKWVKIKLKWAFASEGKVKVYALITRGVCVCQCTATKMIVHVRWGCSHTCKHRETHTQRHRNAHKTCHNWVWWRKWAKSVFCQKQLVFMGSLQKMKTLKKKPYWKRIATNKWKVKRKYAGNKSERQIKLLTKTLSNGRVSMRAYLQAHTYIYIY